MYEYEYDCMSTVVFAGGFKIGMTMMSSDFAPNSIKASIQAWGPPMTPNGSQACITGDISPFLMN